MFPKFASHLKQKAINIISGIASTAVNHSFSTHVIPPPSYISSCQYSSKASSRSKLNRLIDTNPSKLLNIPKKKYNEIKFDFKGFTDCVRKRFLKDPNETLDIDNIRAHALKPTKMFQIAAFLPRFGLSESHMTKSDGSINQMIRKKVNKADRIIFEHISEVQLEEISDHEIFDLIGPDIIEYFDTSDTRLKSAGRGKAVDLLKSKLLSNDVGNKEQLDQLPESTIETAFTRFIWPPANYVLDEMVRSGKLPKYEFFLNQKPRLNLTAQEEPTGLHEGVEGHNNNESGFDHTSGPSFVVIPDCSISYQTREDSTTSSKKILVNIEVKKPFIEKVIKDKNNSKGISMLTQALYQAIASQETDTTIITDYFGGLFINQFEGIEPSSIKITIANKEYPTFKLRIKCKFIPYLPGIQTEISECLALLYIIKRINDKNRKDPDYIKRKLSQMKTTLTTKKKDIGAKLNVEYENSKKMLQQQRSNFNLNHFTIPVPQIYENKYLDQLVLGQHKQVFDISFEKLCHLLKNSMQINDYELLKKQLVIRIPDLQIKPKKLLSVTIYDCVLSSLSQNSENLEQFYDDYLKNINHINNHINDRYALSLNGKDGSLLRTAIGFSGFVTLKNLNSETICSGFFTISLSEGDNPTKLSPSEIKDQENQEKIYNKLFTENHVNGKAFMNKKCYLLTDVEE